MKNNPKKYSQNQKSGDVWFAIRTYNLKEKDFCRFLEEKQLSYVLPSGQKAVHNFVFLKKTQSEIELSKVLNEYSYPVSPLTEENGEWFTTPEPELSSVFSMEDL